MIELDMILTSPVDRLMDAMVDAEPHSKDWLVDWSTEG